MAEEKLPKFAEDDDVARAKALWDEHGKSLAAGIALGLAGIVGFNYWGHYQESRSEVASELFGSIGVDAPIENTRAIASTLKQDFKDTPYAVLAGLLLARQFVDTGDLESAASELSWVVASTEDASMKHIARLRLASVLIARDDPDRALEILENGNQPSSFSSRYHELRGDAYLQRGQQGDRRLAKEAYSKSLELLSEGVGNPALVQLKLENIGEI
ncbi:MAG: tetratricopeptide repeat protein [Gammaproteobacteria bacterium]|nr:tetratricopeptide repeat protein [Gammaproteobacteria bacterium]